MKNVEMSLMDTELVLPLQLMILTWKLKGVKQWDVEKNLFPYSTGSSKRT